MTEQKEFTMFGYTPDELWKIWLTEGEDGFQRIAPFIPRVRSRVEHAIFNLIPSDPRCVSCYAPFRGTGGKLMRAIGRGRSLYNPSLCEDCENLAKRFGAKAKVPVAMLFADVRGSTSLAESMDSEEFAKLIDEFYSRSSRILTDQKALIDKFIGDEVSAFWVPGISGPDYHRLAFESALALLGETGNTGEGEPWISIGIGLHSGEGIVGAIGQPNGVTDLTVLGDTANIAARLASQARPGEFLFSDAIAKKANVESSFLQNDQILNLKGKSNSVRAWSFSYLDKSKG